MSRSWFTAQATSDEEAEIAIYDEIGMFGVTAKDFRDELKALGPVAHINLRINSPGGDVYDGITIHNLLARHKASVTVTVDGVAASIASLIAMAGDAVVMPENAMMMIHNPWGAVIGTSKEMRELAAALDKTTLSMISAYANKSGMNRDQIAELMDAETWLTAEEAVEMGFADSIEKPMKMAALFDLSKFKNAPKALQPRRSLAAPAAARHEEIEMTDTPESGVAEVETAATGDENIITQVQIEPEIAVDEPETADAIIARVRDDERKRSAEIVALCKNAGMAAEFIASGKTVGEVAIAILNEKAANSPEIIARNPGKPPAAVVDTNDVWNKWNAPKH